MNISSLHQAQLNFAKANLDKLHSILTSISNDREKALSFINNPDDFIKKASNGADFPERLHCHIEMEGEIKPIDPENGNQIVVAIRVPIHNQIYDEVYSAFKTTNPVAQDQTFAENPCDKIGCGECLITKLFKSVV